MALVRASISPGRHSDFSNAKSVTAAEGTLPFWSGRHCCVSALIVPWLCVCVCVCVCVCPDVSGMKGTHKVMSHHFSSPHSPSPPLQNTLPENR